MIKYKHIEAARELRLWIGQIVVPGVIMTKTMMSIPEVRYAVSSKIKNMKQNINSKLDKRA